MTNTIIKDFRAVTVSISLTSKSKTPFKCNYAWNFIKIFFRVKFRNMTPMGSNDKIDSMGLSCLTYRRKVAIWSNFIKLVISRPFQIYKKYIFNYWYQISLIKKNNSLFINIFSKLTLLNPRRYRVSNRWCRDKNWFVEKYYLARI